MFYTIRWEEGAVSMIDQRKLPLDEVYLRCETCEEVAEAIEGMAVRGAPAIGVAAAFGIALAVRRLKGLPRGEFDKRFEEACERLAATRPTAVNLFWAIDRMRRVRERHRPEGTDRLIDRIVGEALEIHNDDLEICRRIGANGESLIRDGATVLTHCNAGALATAGHGTALGVIRSAFEKGKKLQVLADETRPLLQGARLTAWELRESGIPVTLITDNMAGHFISRGAVDLVVVGADRIAANGDTANKIGTYTVAVLARHNKVPFYVAAPLSTIDRSTPDGGSIPIEERSPSEVTAFHGTRTSPDGVPAHNPAFDVTPHQLVSALITERGVVENPDARKMREHLEGAGREPRDGD